MWIMPLKVAPVVSYDMLKRGRMERPRNGLDRLNLTDVGEALIAPHLEEGGVIELRDVRLPYPWKARLVGGAEMNIEALRAGNSTFRSIIMVRFPDGDGPSTRMRDLLQGLERDPLETPYWDIGSWESFFKETGMTKDDVSKNVHRTMRKLGLD